MIDLVLNIPDFGWTAMFHVAVSCYHADTIVDELKSAGCPVPILRRAHLLLSDCTYNQGLTYSNSKERISIVVVGKTSSASEFLSTLEHEIRHLVDDIVVISKFYDKEDIAYLTGEINKEIYPFVQPLLCEECRRIVS